MRIQCKGCGKEYQVNEKRLTPEGIRVRCKSCGTVLLVRLRQEQKTPPAPEEAAPSIRGKKRQEDVPSIETPEAPVVAPEPHKAPPAAEEAVPSIREEKSPVDLPQIEPPEAPVEAPRPQKVSKSKEAPSGYRYCITCGKLLEKVLSVDDRPVCAICSSMATAGAPGAVPGMKEPQASASSLKKVLMFIFIIIIVFFAGVMGYRIARGEIFTMNFLSRQIENFTSPENVMIPIRVVEQFLPGSEEF